VYKRGGWRREREGIIRVDMWEKENGGEGC